MDILYLPRDLLAQAFKGGRPSRRRLRKFMGETVQRRRFYGIEGFIRGALHARFRVTQKHWRLTPWLLNPRRFDAIFISARAGMPTAAMESLLRRAGSAAKVLIVDDDNAAVMPDDAMLDRFDLILKREPFRDRDRYSIREHNKAKIRPTMLSCPLVQVRDGRPDRWRPETMLANVPPREITCDVSFIGADTSDERIAVCDRVAAQPWRSHVGIVYARNRPRHGDAAARQRLEAPRLERADSYIRLIRASAVNLALAGFGQFTHRHLEIWALGGFMLSSPGLREIELPGVEPIEGEHYVAFDDLDDLVAKIEYYRQHEAPRERIAAAGRRLFEQLYDFNRHGQAIERWLAEI